LSQISQLTYHSYQVAQQMQLYLMQRLAKSHYNVKYKTLVILRHVCRTGRPEFKRDMQGRVDAIRECLQFKGPPDTLRGDEIYRRVRDCAREVLEGLFDGQTPQSSNAATANRIQGFGSG
ncbi:hypothetical protein B484DRAFT_314370, partial [Ochromonadaceae sp. CCMP2298]